jgi:hypothetical protein
MACIAPSVDLERTTRRHMTVHLFSSKAESIDFICSCHLVAEPLFVHEPRGQVHPQSAHTNLVLRTDRHGYTCFQIFGIAFGFRHCRNRARLAQACTYGTGMLATLGVPGTAIISATLTFGQGHFVMRL